MGRPRKVVAENSAENVTKTTKATKAVKTAKAPNTERIEFRLSTIKVPIIGTSSLIVHKFGQKAWLQLVEGGKAKKELIQGGKKSNICDPEEDFRQSLHVMQDGKTLGFPCVGFKNAIVEAGYQAYKKTKTSAKASFYIVPDGYDEKGDGLVKINGVPRLREDAVRIGGISKTTSPRYRAEFPEWSAELTIQYVEGLINPRDLLQLVMASGWMNGIGEWRPEKGGEHGMYTTVSA